MRSPIAESVAPSAASTAAAWMTMPKWRTTSTDPAPTAISSSQRSPQRVNDSTCDGETRMRAPPGGWAVSGTETGAASGPGSDSLVSWYQ
jgi:hypothetical protein